MKELVKKPLFWIAVIVVIILGWMWYKYYNCKKTAGSSCDPLVTIPYFSLSKSIASTPPTPALPNTPLTSTTTCNFFTGKKCI